MCINSLEYLIKFMTIGLSVRLLAALQNYSWLDRTEKNDKIGVGPTYIQLNFEITGSI